MIIDDGGIGDPGIGVGNVRSARAKAAVAVAAVVPEKRVDRGREAGYLIPGAEPSNPTRDDEALRRAGVVPARVVPTSTEQRTGSDDRE